MHYTRARDFRLEVCSNRIEQRWNGVLNDSSEQEGDESLRGLRRAADRARANLKSTNKIESLRVSRISLSQINDLKEEKERGKKKDHTDDVLVMRGYRNDQVKSLKKIIKN